MSVTEPDHPSFDSGHNHLKPFIVAIVIFVAVVAATLLVAGLPP